MRWQTSGPSSVRTRKGPARGILLAAWLPCASLYACSADLLSFNITQTPSPAPQCDNVFDWLGSDTWAGYAGVSDSSTLRVEDLSYGDAYALCQWIDQGQNPCSEPSVARGYATGQSATCSWPTATGSSPTLSIVWLGLDDCVANLQHEPCTALVSDLVGCVESFGAHLGDLDCSRATAACGAFESAEGCDQTVVQSSSTAEPASPLAATCAVSLPVLPDVSCPPAETMADAGSDSE
jgi:hypothetical protein